MLKNHIKIAIRNLMASRLFTALNILGLTGGMVAAVFILLWVQNELSFDAYHQKSSRIVRILTDYKVSKVEVWHWTSTPLLLANEIKRLPEIQGVSRKLSGSDLAITLGGRKIAGKNVAYVDSNWFEFFDYKFIDGSATDFKASIRNVAMSRSKALQLFGQTNMAGKLIRIDTLDYNISAVYEDNPSNSSFQYDFVLPLPAYLSDPENLKNDVQWGNFNYETYLVLRNDTNRKKLGQKLTGIISKTQNDDNGKPTNAIVLKTEALTDIHFDGLDSGRGKDAGDRKTIYIFLGLALVILFVACINYINLTTARANVRSKEVGVKKLLGAKYSHLFGQFMTESIITCLIAFLSAFALIYVLLPSFNNLTGKHFVLAFSNLSLWYVLVGTTLTAIVLTGVYPSLLLSSFKPFEILRGNTILGSGNGGFRKGLVIVQFTVSVVFLISTLVVYQQMKYIREKNLGYDRSHVLTFSLPWNLTPRVEAKTVKTMLTGESAIADVTFSSQNIVEIYSSHSGSLDFDGRPADFKPTVSQIGVQANFQKMFGLKILEGRWFAENSVSDESNVVLNETAVKKLNIRKPVINQRFHFQGKKGVVIGVVKDFHFKSLRDKIPPLVMFPDEGRGIYVKTYPGKEAEGIQAIEKMWGQMVPNYPLDYKFLDETFDRLYKSEQRTATLFNTFTIVALIISCLGLFGLATFTAERRFKEIGIRKVLGASVTAIVSLLSKEFVMLILISICIASPIAFYFMNDWLQGFEYRIHLHWSIFVVAALGSVAIALFTISYQSIKAALMNPVKTLRSE